MTLTAKKEVGTGLLIGLLYRQGEHCHEKLAQSRGILGGLGNLFFRLN